MTTSVSLKSMIITLLQTKWVFNKIRHWRSPNVIWLITTTWMSLKWKIHMFSNNQIKSQHRHVLSFPCKLPFSIKNIIHQKFIFFFQFIYWFWLLINFFLWTEKEIRKEIVKELIRIYTVLMIVNRDVHLKLTGKPPPLWWSRLWNCKETLLNYDNINNFRAI